MLFKFKLRLVAGAGGILLAASGLLTASAIAGGAPGGSSVASATAGLVNGLVPPIAGCEWQAEQLFAL
jgi:hypothetical protein